MNEEEIRDIELAEKVNKIIYYDFKNDIKNDIFIVLDALVNATELKDLSATQTLIKNQYHIIQNKHNEHLEKIIQNQKAELQKKDKIIDELEDTFYNYQLCEYELTDCTYRKCEYIADDETPPCKECIKQYFENKVTDTNVGERKV